MSWLRNRIDLLQHLNVLRWVLPTLAFIVVLLHQIVEHFTMLRAFPWRLHFASQVLFYGIAGPLVVWVLFTGIKRSVEARERATAQLATLYEFSRRLLTLTDEALHDAIVQFPNEFLDMAGCSLMLFDSQSGVASIAATNDLPPAHDELLRDYAFTSASSRRCRTCQAQRATVTNWCTALPSDLIEDGDIASVVCLPLARGDRLLGRLNIYLRIEEPPADDMLRLLNAMAAEAAIAIESERLRTRELETLYEVNTMMRRHVDDLDSTLLQILRNTIEACAAEAGAILLRGESEDAFEARVTVPQSFTIAESHTIERLVSQRRGAVQVSDLKGFGDSDAAGSLTAIPMIVDDDVLGVLCLAHARREMLSERQLHLLSAVSGQVALIIQNARYYARLESYAILEERSRLAREMHDGLAQGLGYLNVKAQHALRRLRQQRVTDAEDDVAEIRGVVQGLYSEVRTAIEGLRTSFDPDKPFVTNVETYVATLSTRTDTALRVEIDEAVDLPASVAVHVLRIIQEALTNVIRHAEATECVVCLAEDDRAVTVTIRDDGCGFDPSATVADSRFGIESMRERARMLGGQLDISSERQRGTTVSVRLPVIRDSVSARSMR